jgi:hypothetical protein
MSGLLARTALVVVMYGIMFTGTRWLGIVGQSGAADVAILILFSATAVYVSQPLSIISSVVLFIVSLVVEAVLAVTILYAVFGESF